jgi:hypothetical protein
MVHAPRTGVPVTVVDNVWQSSSYARQFIGAVRAIPAAAPTTAPAPPVLPEAVRRSPSRTRTPPG